MRKLFISFALMLIALFAGVQVVGAQTVYKVNENFDGITSGIPANWDNADGTTTTETYKWNSFATGYSGRCLRFNSYSNGNGNTNMLKTPVMDLSTGQWILKFKYKNPAGGDFSVFISTDGGATYTTPLFTGLTAQTDWTAMETSITAAAAQSQQVKIVFQGTSNYGSDYNGSYIFLDDVSVESAPTCQSPTGLNVTGLSMSGATLNWDLTVDGDVPGSYIYTLTDAGGNVIEQNAALSAPGLTYTIQAALTANTTYTASLQSDCQSSYSGQGNTATVTFTTMCPVQNAPYAENFDSLTALPQCTYSNGASIATSGKTGKGLQLLSTGAGAYIVFPELNLASNDVEMSFQIKSTAAGKTYMVALVTDISDIENSEILFTGTTANANWNDVRMNTTSSALAVTNTSRLCIMLAGDAATFGIDDVNIHQMPTCARPESFTVYDVEAYQATLDWDMTNATNVRVYAMNTADSSVITALATNHPFTMTGLSEQTTYQFKVIGICSSNDSSEFTNPVTVKTKCGVAASTVFFEGAETTSGTALPNCWETDFIANPSSRTDVPFFTGTGTKLGTRGFVLRDMQSGTQAYMCSQKLNFDVANKYSFRYQINRTSGTSYNGEGLKIFVTPTIGDTTNAVAVIPFVNRCAGNSPVGTAGWNTYEGVINYQGEGYIMVVGCTKWGSYTYFDNLEVFLTPTCPKITSLSAGNTTKTTADIYWTAGLNETQWLISYELKQGATTLATVNDTLVNQPSVTLSGLNSATTYTVSASVRAYCGVGDTAEVVTMNPTNVTTQCDAISQLPYTMGFEDGETFVKSGSTRHPLCWTHYNNATSTSDTYKYAPYAYNSNARTGSRCLYYYNYSSSTSYGDTATFALPEIDSTAYAINTLRVKFWTRNSSTSYSQILYVGVMTDPNDPTTFVKVDSFTVSGTTYAENVASFANYAGTGTHIAFAWYKNAITSSSSTVYLDDVTVDPIPNCADLVGTINLTGVSDTSVTFTIADQTATAWQYAYGLTGTPLAQMTPVSHTGTSCTITGLAEATTYDIYVRRDCGTETGAWSQVTTFSTTAVPAQMPYVCGFEDAQENYRWQYVDGAGANVFTIGTDANGVYAGTNAMYVTNNRSTGSYTYNTSSATHSYAYRTMHFDAKGYQFEFKFKCTGGESSYDFGRILLTNATVSLPSGQTGAYYSNCTFPTAIVEFDDEFLNGSFKMFNTATYNQGNPDANGWVTISRFIDMTNRPGDYNLVLLWNDDTSAGTANYPLAIDNINVYQLTCIPPTNVLTDSITSTSACLNIVQGGDPVAQWEVVVSDQPFTKESVPDSATYRQVVDTNHVSLTGLTPNTIYYYIVRAVCGANDSSAWNEVQQLHTFCANENVPYSEGFEGPTSVACWSVFGSTGTVTRNSSVRHSDNASMKIDGADVVSPKFNVTTFAPFMLNGWCRATSDSVLFSVGVMLDPNDETTFEPLTSVLIPNANQWVEFTSYFSLLLDPDESDYYNARYIAISVTNGTIVYFDDLIVDEIPTCPKPTEVSITNIGAHSFDISFTDNTEGEANSWVVYTNGTPNVITTNPATITGLAAHATYNVGIAAICSNTDTSLTTMCGQINTLCDALPVPYSCGFETSEGFNYTTGWVDGVLEGECWNTIGMRSNGTYPYYKITNSTYLHNGTQGLMGYSLANAYAYLILPALQEPTNTLTMEFWYRNESTYAGSPYVEVGYMTDPADSTTFVMLQQTPKTATFTKVEQSFVNPAIPANARIAFRFGGSTASNYYMGLDDIMVKAIRNCSDPNQPTVSDITHSSAKVSFTDTCATHNAWEYVFGIKGIDPATATPVSLTTDTFSVAGLTPVTNYDVYVRAVCGVGDYSNWMKASFTTASVPASLPYVCDFSDAAEANMWEAAGTETNAFVSGQDANAAFTTGGSALFVSSDASSYGYNTGSTASSAAFRILNFEASSYSIEFDWKCSGGESGYDVGRAYLIPASATAITLTNASTLPTGAIDLTDGTIMQGATGVQHVAKVIDFTNMAGYYKLVFAWRNDGSMGDQYPLSVSNIAISELSCQLIANTNVSSVTSSSATVTFSNPNTGAPTQWVLSTSTSVADSVRTGVTTSDTIYLSNLAAASSYNLLLSAICSETSTSPYVAVPITTSCGVISTFPYAQGFDSYAANTIPLCWDNSASTTSTVTSDPSYVWGVYDVGGNKALRMWNYNVSYGTALIETPQFDLPAQPVEMTFDYSHNASCGDFTVEISINNGASYTPLGSYGSNGQGTAYTTGTMTNVTIDLTNYANESVKFRIFANATYGSGAIFFDNMVVNYIPACRGPKTAPTINGFTMTTMSAQANMAGKDSIEFGIAPYTSGVTPADITATQVSTDGNACFTGLTGSTQYAIWYRYLCDSVNISDWSLAFATATTMGTDCFDPQMLRTVGVINNVHAAFTWSGAPDATLYEYELYRGTSATGTRIDSATVATADTIVYDSLTAITNYYFRVRSFCATDTTNWVGMAIKTTRQPASLPFICGFENAGDAALWELNTNGLGDAFVIGNGTNHGGSNALYISDDGSTYNYTSLGSEAYARVLLPMTAGNYMVTYDYNCIGETSYDYGRVFLYPASNAVGFYDYGSLSSANVPGNITVSPTAIVNLSDWTSAQYVVNIPADAMYYLQFNWTTDNAASWTYNPPLGIDNISITEINCMPLSSVANIGLTDHSASYVVTRSEPGIDVQYGYSIIDNVDSITWTTIQSTGLTDTIRMRGLAANTTYYLFARQACDSVNMSSATRTVVTTTPAAQNIPFICGFETSEATTTAWAFANDATNAFVIGGGAQSTGSQAMYISDNGSNWNYTVSATSYSYAYVPLAFGPGTYDIEYDWNCIGEGGYDYGRVFLAPASFIPTGGQFVSGIGTTGTPSGWIALDGNAKLNQVAGWNSRSLEQTFADSTNMNLILYWYNDASAGTQPPIAYDNIRITQQTCPSIQISTVGVDTVSTDMFTLHYVNPNAGASTMWILSSNNQYTDTVAMGVQPATDSTFTATGLAAGTQYFCRLYSVCDSADMSKALKFTIRTQCAIRTQYPYTEGFEDFATNTYNLLTGACWSTTTMSSSLYGVVRDATSVADAVHSGSQGLHVYNGSSTGVQVYALPEMDSLNGKTISFWHKAYSNTSSYITLSFGYINAAGTFVSLDEFSNKQTVWMEYNNTIQNLPAGVTRLAFQFSGYYYYYLDDIHINTIATADTIFESVCNNQDYSGHGVTIPSAQMVVGNNIFTKTVQATAPGISDTTFIFCIYKRPAISSDTYDTICAGQPYNKGMWQIANPVSRLYFQNYPGAAVCGCDSADNLYLTVIPTTSTINDTICQGDAYQFGTQTITQTGTYVDTIPSQYGCDIITTLNLFVVDSVVPPVVASICNGEQYQFAGQTFTKAGIYRVPVVGARGCTTIKILDLTVVKSDSTLTVHFCKGGSINVCDTIIMHPGQYDVRRFVQTDPNNPDVGCYTTYHITAIEDPIKAGTAADYACQDHPYYGYGVSGKYITKDTTVIQTGLRDWTGECDSMVTVSIKYIASIKGYVLDTAIAAGASIIWGDQTRDKSGYYYDTVPSKVTGCDSILTLKLTVGGVEPVGVENVQMLNISLVPNPVNAGQTAFVYGNFTNVKSVEVLNSFGQVVDTFVPSTYPIEIQSINASGIYYVRVVTEDEKVAVQKLIVK